MNKFSSKLVFKLIKKIKEYLGVKLKKSFEDLFRN